jgi:hypothetical protein
VHEPAPVLPIVHSFRTEQSLIRRKAEISMSEKLLIIIATGEKAKAKTGLLDAWRNTALDARREYAGKIISNFIKDGCVPMVF